MSNTSIQLKKSGITGNTPTPSALSHGELALNYADGKLYYKDDTGLIQFINNQHTFETIIAQGELLIATGPSDILVLQEGSGVNLEVDTIDKSITFNSYDAVAAHLKSNSAFNKANAAFNKANDAYTLIVNGGGGGGLPIGGVYLTRSYVGDAITTDFTVTNGVTDDSVIVAENGIVQLPNVDYTISGTTLSFLVPPANNTLIQVRELGSNLDELSRLTANAAFIQANAAFAQANAGGGSAVITVGSYANSAFEQANASFEVANSTTIRTSGAFTHANGAYDAANVGYDFVNNGGTISGSVTITDSLYISGNILIGGNSTTISSNNLTLTDSILYLSDENPANVTDIGIVGAYTDTNGYLHLGLVRDHTDGVWKLFSNVANEPTSTVDFTGARYDGLKLGELQVVGDSHIDTTLFVGSGVGSPLGGATNPIIGALGSANGYIQNYTYNTANGRSSSADICLYPNNGSDAYGWIDVGITSNNYSDDVFSVTGRNEGYVLMSAPLGAATSGNLVIATDSTGTHNALEVFIGGFDQGKESPVLVVDGSKVKTNRELVFVDGTKQNTAAAPFAYTNAAFIQANAAFNKANVANNVLVNGSHELELDIAGQVVLPQMTLSGYTTGTIKSAANLSFDVAGNIWKFDVDGNLIGPSVDLTTEGIRFADGSHQTTSAASLSYSESSYANANAAFDRANNSLNVQSGGTITGNINVTSANVSLGDVSNLHIYGGNTGQILVTDINGNLTFIDLPTTNTTTYTANTLSLTNGVYVSGSVTDIQTLNDGNFYEITDGSNTGPAWIITTSFTDVIAFNRVVSNVDYTVASGHTVYFQLYNYTTSAWDNIGSFSGASGYSQYALEVLDYTSYISGGTVQVRLYHSNAGNVSHTVKLDYLALELSAQGAQGPRGATGATGSTGAGVPTGGTSGQVLVKNSSTNYDTVWSNDLLNSYDTANSAGSYANSAFVQANSSYDVATSSALYANGAFIKANAAFLVANTPTHVANSAALYANSAFLHANAAFAAANAASGVSDTSAGSYANSAFTAANSAGSYANSAFLAANNKLSLSGGTITGPVTINSDLTVTGNVSYTGNVTNVTITGNTGQFFGDSANGFQALYAGVPTGYTFQEQTVLQTTGDFDGYVQVNIQNINSGSNASADLVATNDNQAGDAYIDLGINSTTYDNPEYELQYAGDGYLYVSANTDTGGGNLVFSTTAAGRDIVFSTGGTTHDSEVARFKEGVGLVLKSTPITFADGTTQNTAVSLVYTQAAFLHANAAFAAANTGGGGVTAPSATANSAALYANAAFIQANAAFIQANTPDAIANSAALYANGAFVQANSAYSLANTINTTYIQTSISPFLLMGA